MRKCLISLLFALLWIPCSAQEATDSIDGLEWCYHVGHANADYWDYYRLSGRKYYKGHFYHVMYLKRIITGYFVIDNFSLKNICIREDQGKVYVMKDEYLDLMDAYSTWNKVGDATHLPYEETEEGELVLYDYNMQPGDRFPHVDGHEDIVVTQCGDTITQDGVSRKTILLSNGCEIIEGMGCINSVAGPMFYLNPKKNAMVWGHLKQLSHADGSIIYYISNWDLAQWVMAILDGLKDPNYEPFIVDGKVWYYEHVDYNQYHHNYYVYKVFFEGDTVVDGHLCKKLVEERPGFDNYSPCACREENGKVWAYYSHYSNQPWQKWLLFDFTCQVGDTVTNILTYGSGKFLVDEVGYVSSFGRDRRRVAINRGDGQLGYWLEGVGGRYDMFSVWHVVTAASERFLYCELNGERIADQSSFGDAALESLDIRETISLDEDNTPVYDLFGRRLNGVPNHGFYIRNGRKYVK